MLQICGHFPLNSYLHRINKADSNLCQACADDDEGTYTVETINHFIFDCPRYEDIRNDMIEEISIEHFSLSDIMSDINRMKTLTAFINRSGRFGN
jgi:hypothetical protein